MNLPQKIQYGAVNDHPWVKEDDNYVYTSRYQGVVRDEYFPIDF